MVKTAVTVLLFALFGGGALALWLRVAEPRLIYYPDRVIALTPDRLGLDYEDVWLTADDGVRLNGWFLPSGRPAGLTLLLLHGNAGNISHRFEKYAVFRELGVDVFALDYRGYGRSEGEPSEPGTYLDAAAAYRYLIEKRGVDPRKLVVYGESLGAVVAVELAARSAVAGVVMEGVFTSAADVGQAMFPFLPVRWLAKNKYDALARIGRINAPLLILHSRDDEFFGMRHPQKLLAAAQAPKELVELRGGHNDAFLVSAELYRNSLQRFFDSLRGAQPQTGEVR
ncbi:MAG: alpha/beta hydrolase [Pseudomonadota bacterium]